METNDKAATSSLWPYLVLLALAMFIVLNLMRPCEGFRIRTTVTDARFGWTQTVCGPMPFDGTCYCSTTGPDPWMIQGAGRATRASDRWKATEVKPEVVF